MSDYSDSSNGKYKWTPDSTQLLVSVWSDRQVQKQLEYTSKPQLIWESVSRYMKKKGYEVTAKQCKSRMKQVLVCYREAKRSGTRNGIERYYESIDKVLEIKRSDKFESNNINSNTNNNNNNNNNGVDTVDSTNVNFKSPPKELKTNANLRMRQNKLEDQIGLHNIEVIPGDWQYEREDYPDSSESNETVLARPCRPFSPLKDVGTNTVSDSMKLIGKSVRRSLNQPDDRFKYENVETNRFSELPLKIQNVQNHIIQENMLMKNQMCNDNIAYHYSQPEYRINMNNPGPPRPILNSQNIVYNPQRISGNMARMQSQLQQYSLGQNSAVPQEPRKFGNIENPMLNTNGRSYKTYAEVYSSDIAPNLNEAFYQVPQTRNRNGKIHNLNETFDQEMDRDDESPVQMNATNNATYNDDTISIEFLQDSPSPTENDRATKNNLDEGPNVPERKKKIQKIEQLMLNAITSQSEVVNKILAAQDSMVSKLLDLDKDRQNRLETRLDQLMTVVQATVLNKSGDSGKSDNNNNNREVTPPPTAPPLTFDRPTCFSPPPKPGTMPPKLDLVPPKPCRVPCTTANNANVMNQKDSQSHQNIGTRPGTIWSKLGPVSQSPFVKAQQQISAVTKAADHWRTKSSAERRIARSYNPFSRSGEIIEETYKFVEGEKLMEERIENARHLLVVDNDHPARRKLFENDEKTPENKEINKIEKKEPSAAVVLTSTFLDFERKAEEKLRSAMNAFDTEYDSDDLLTGQGESYDRLRRLSIRPKPKANKLHMNTSTPAKNDFNDPQVNNEPRQTIQQLAELVMNSARWRNDAHNENGRRLSNYPQANNNNKYDIPPKKPPREFEAQRLSREKAIDWLQDRYAYGVAKTADNHPIGFYPGNLKNDADLAVPTFDRGNIEFNRDVLPPLSRMQNLELIENEIKTYERLQQIAAINNQIQAKANENHNKMLNKQKEEDEDDEFLDTTTTLHSKRNSLTSGTSSNKQSGCIIS